MSKKTLTTTISAYSKTRDKVAAIAERLDLSQRDCLKEIVEDYERRSRKKRSNDVQMALSGLSEFDLLSMILQKLDKIEKRENPHNLIASFFKTQERDILSPMRNDVMKVVCQNEQIITGLSSIH